MDKRIIIFAIFAAAILGLLGMLWHYYSAEGLVVRVEINNQLYTIKTLKADTFERLVVQGANGESVVEIDGARVRMVESACPDKLCVKVGYISRAGEVIVCLPNRVLIIIKEQAP
ncbi:MAG: NusG domain II-containing protein [bacterium]|nr:NusG domain II-containing protein [bacterium]